MIRVCEKQRRKRFPEQVARNPQHDFVYAMTRAHPSARGHVHCVGPDPPEDEEEKKGGREKGEGGMRGIN